MVFVPIVFLLLPNVSSQMFAKPKSVYWELNLVYKNAQQTFVIQYSVFRFMPSCLQNPKVFTGNLIWFIKMHNKHLLFNILSSGLCQVEADAKLPH